MTINENIFFEIKEQTDFIRIEVVEQNFPDAELDWDKNSLKCLMSAKCGVFSGEFEADLMSVDFEIFKKELEIVYDNLNRSATFEGIERQVNIRVEGDGIGHLSVRFSLTDTENNQLKGNLSFDQTGLPLLIKQLENILSKYIVYR
ncbi:WapI family immunity protein [Flavobacterium sp.]